MKFLRSTALMAVAVAISTSFVVTQGELQHVPVAGIPEPQMVIDTAEKLGKVYLRQLRAQDGSNSNPTPTTTPPTTTTPAPTPTTPTPTTTPPTPTTPGPSPTTAPPPNEPTTTPPSTPETPVSTTPPPQGGEGTTPKPTTRSPSGNGGVTSSASSSNGAHPKTPKTATTASAEDNNEGDDTKNKTETKSSTMSTGAVIGIVAGIVGGVALVAFLAVSLRRRGDNDDDPLSPFELSMDKGHNGAPAYTATANNNNYGNAYGAATTAPARNSREAAANTQFYDVPPSPGSLYHQQPNPHNDRVNSSSTDETNNATNLWLSAMEPKEDNDIEGHSVPPGSGFSDDNSSFASSSRQSFEHSQVQVQSLDVDNSSVLSGNSDLDKDFPEFEDETSRGSYEL